MRFDEMPREQLLKIASIGGKTPRPRPPMRKVCNKGHKLIGDNVEPVTRYSYNKDRTKRYSYRTYRCHQCMLDSGQKRKLELRRIKHRQRIEQAQVEQAVIKYCKHGHALVDGDVGYYKRFYTLRSGIVRTTTDRVCLACARAKYHAKKAKQSGG